MRRRTPVIALWLMVVLALAACAPGGASNSGGSNAAPTTAPSGGAATGGETTAGGATAAVTDTTSAGGATAAVTGTTTTGGAAGGAAAGGNTAPVTFWAAPNPPQGVFWNNMAKAYMEANPGTNVQVSNMPESPTSEAGIQTALAGGTAPGGSENIFIGFGQQLASSQALVPLDTMPGWNELIQARHMEKTIEGWKFPDGHYYVLPIYSNAMLMGWRLDMLKEAGVDKPPRTYSEVMAAGEKIKAKFPDKFLWARAELTQDTWWQRWFDFFIFYDAASNGKPLITGNALSADDQAAVKTLQFFSDLQSKKYLLTQTATDPFETGLAAMGVIGPWSFATWAQKYPDLKLNETFVLTSPPVPDDYPADQPIKTFADAKGLVLYKSSSPEVQQSTWAFIQWVFSDPKHDLEWLQRTSLPPARDDLSTNETFKSFFTEHPELAPYAEQIPNAVPPLSTGQFQEMQTSLGQQAVIPVVTGQAQPQAAWDTWKNSATSLVGQ